MFFKGKAQSKTWKMNLLSVVFKMNHSDVLLAGEQGRNSSRLPIGATSDARQHLMAVSCDALQHLTNISPKPLFYLRL